MGEREREREREVKEKKKNTTNECMRAHWRPQLYIPPNAFPFRKTTTCRTYYVHKYPMHSFRANDKQALRREKEKTRK